MPDFNSADATEYVVTATTPRRGQRYVGTIYAADPADAVERTVDLLERREDGGNMTEIDFRRLVTAREAEQFTAYRADSGSLVKPDELNDADDP